MTRVLHGIVHGKIIEVTEDLGMLDGQAVELIVTASPGSAPSAEGSDSEKTAQKAAGPAARLAAGWHGDRRRHDGRALDRRGRPDS